MNEPKSTGARLLMYQERLDALIADIEREGLVMNVHYVPDFVSGAMHVGAIWPAEQWKQFYERGDRERLIGQHSVATSIVSGDLTTPTPGAKGTDWEQR